MTNAKIIDFNIRAKDGQMFELEFCIDTAGDEFPRKVYKTVEYFELGVFLKNLYNIVETDSLHGIKGKYIRVYIDDNGNIILRHIFSFIEVII